jgi:DNA-binding transcriptional MocR family regulator|tara:strand:- start:493 stop:831 length:339 start_codon:yes stop_codon:yes gene_type:complete
MSEFFDSKIVQQSLKEITDIQEEIFNSLFTYRTFTEEDKQEHIDKLRSLIEKQRIMYTRLTLTDDPEAIELKQKIEQSALMLGFPEGTNMSEVFDTMDETLIQVIKTSGLDN